jgi:aldehyde dehydrogenase (NAD+)
MGKGLLDTLDLPLSSVLAGQPVNNGPLLAVSNPYTGEILCSVATVSAGQVAELISRVAAAPVKLSRQQRVEILQAVAERLLRLQDDFSALISLETGLCRKDTRTEVRRAADVFAIAAHYAIQDHSDYFPGDIGVNGKPRRIMTLREPLRGVIAAITPFNFPLNQVAHKLAPAIATNNRMIVKPSEKAPLSALLLAKVVYEAGLPPEALSVVVGEPAAIADTFLSHPAVDLLTFTGSTHIGQSIAARAGYRRLVLELGGNDPCIILADADPQVAAKLVVQGAFGNSGQRCTAIKRVLVHETIAEAVLQETLVLTRALRVGDPLDEATDLGCLIDEAAAHEVERRIQAAVAQGAVLLSGGGRRGTVTEPTVLDQVSPEMELVKLETFGPVAPFIRFQSLDEAIEIANATEWGLSASVCTDSLSDAMRLVRELQVGSVNIGEAPGYRSEASPFGGIKHSGLGVKEGVAKAMEAYTHLKAFSLPWPL